MRILNKILAIVTVVLGALAFANPAAAELTYTFTSGSDVAVTGSNYVASGALNLTLAFSPTPGTNLTVVKNTGLPFLSGTFDGVPQGGTVPLTYSGVTYNYIANYYGGNGRSLVLQWPCVGLAAWGDNCKGELGNSGTTNSTVPVAVTTSGTPLAGKTVVAIAAGYWHTLALTSDGQVFAWGANGSGQLGNNSTTDILVPVAVSVGKNNVVAIAAGAFHSLALTSDGQVFAWGLNNAGQLGNNSNTDSSVPVAVNTSGVLSKKKVVAIAGGSYHSLALTSDGQVFAWGANDYGALGNNSTTRSTVPVEVTTNGALDKKTVTAIDAGDFHSLAFTSDGLIFAWGYNGDGELGNGGTTKSLVPVAVSTSGTLAGQTVETIAAGWHHNLVLTSAGQVFDWGWNSVGQLGNSGTTNSTVPVAVNTNGVLAGETVVNIYGGGSHSLLLTSDGKVFTWGANQYGQLGNSSKTNSSVPVAVDTSGVLADKTVVAIAGGNLHSVAMFGSGPPTATTNPAIQTVISGTTVTLTAVATDNPAPTVQWQVSTTGTAGTFSNIDSVTNPTAATGTLTLSNVTPAQNGYAYRAVFTNLAGSSTTTAAALTVQRTFAWFQNQYGLSDPNPTADPNRTGVCQLAAYAFGVDPVTPDRSQLPKVAFQDDGLQVSYQRWKDAADLTYVVEVSDDLKTWVSGTNYTEQVSVMPIDATREQVVERDLTPASSVLRRFMRVRITKPW